MLLPSILDKVDVFHTQTLQEGFFQLPVLVAQTKRDSLDVKCEMSRDDVSFLIFFSGFHVPVFFGNGNFSYDEPW